MVVISVAVALSALFVSVAVIYSAYKWAQVRGKEEEHRAEDLAFWREQEIRNKMIESIERRIK